MAAKYDFETLSQALDMMKSDDPEGRKKRGKSAETSGVFGTWNEKYRAGEGVVYFTYEGTYGGYNFRKRCEVVVGIHIHVAGVLSEIYSRGIFGVRFGEIHFGWANCSI